MIRFRSKHFSAMTEAAVKAGAFEMRHFGKVPSSRVHEKSINDIVTFVDRKSQDIIVGTLKKKFPEYGIIAEESEKPLRAERTWVIDPLDGTANFVRHYPLFAISIALSVEGKPVLGLILDPVHKECFTGAWGEGAYLNRRRIHVSRLKNMKRAFIVTGFPFRSREYFEPYHESFRRIFYASSGIRRGGSAALDLCYTACGRADGFWEFGLKEWDMCAGSLIVTEAGGSVSNFRGESGFLETGDIIAGNPSIHRRLLACLRGIRGFKRSI